MFCTFWPVSTLIISMVLELHPHNAAKNRHTTVLASEMVLFMCDNEEKGVSSCYFWALTPKKARNSSRNMMQIEPWSFQWRSKLLWTKNSKLRGERDLSYPLTSPMGMKCHQEYQNSRASCCDSPRQNEHWQANAQITIILSGRAIHLHRPRFYCRYMPQSMLFAATSSTNRSICPTQMLTTTSANKKHGFLAKCAYFGSSGAWSYKPHYHHHQE